MRTTIDLPDELLRRAKATAALRGISLKDLLTSFVETCLGKEPEVYGHRAPIPVAIPNLGKNMPTMTNAEISEILDAEEDKGLA